MYIPDLIPLLGFFFILRELATKGLPAASAASSGSGGGSGETGSGRGTAVPDLLETPVGGENKDPNQLAGSEFPIE